MPSAKASFGIKSPVASSAATNESASRRNSSSSAHSWSRNARRSVCSIRTAAWKIGSRRFHLSKLSGALENRSVSTSATSRKPLPPLNATAGLENLNRKVTTSCAPRAFVRIALDFGTILKSQQDYSAKENGGVPGKHYRAFGGLGAR